MWFWQPFLFFKFGGEGHYILPGMTGPPNSFTARGPVTLTAILFTHPAV